MIDGPPPEQTTKCRRPSASGSTRLASRASCARLVIILRFGLEPLGDRALAVGRGGGDQRVGLVRLGDARRAVEDEGRGDVRLVEQQLGLQQLELEADRPQILAQQEVHVLEGEPIGGVAVCGPSVGWAAVSASSRAGWKTRLGGFGIGHARL